jgi:hypothetical protein
LTERAIATLAVGFLRLMIADISLSGEHEEAFVAVDNPKKLTPGIKADRTYIRHETMPGSKTGQTMLIPKNVGLL